MVQLDDITKRKGQVSFTILIQSSDPLNFFSTYAVVMKWAWNSISSGAQFLSIGSLLPAGRCNRQLVRYESIRARFSSSGNMIGGHLMNRPRFRIAATRNVKDEKGRSSPVNS